MNDLDRFLAKHDDRVAEWLPVIEDMLSRYDEYSWAEDTLIGIYDHIEANNTITDGQIRAVQNIREAAERNRFNRFNRRRR